MSQLLNQYSAFMLFILPLGLLVAAVALRQRGVISRIALLAGLALLIVIGFWVLRPGPAGTPPDEVQTLLASSPGRPVLVELYSDY